MTRATRGIDSPGIDPDPQPDDPGLIGGRAETWPAPRPPMDDDSFEPTIIRGRE
jgi:hypothetical protein